MRTFIISQQKIRFFAVFIKEKNIVSWGVPAFTKVMAARRLMATPLFSTQLFRNEVALPNFGLRRPTFCNQKVGKKFWGAKMRSIDHVSTSCHAQ